MGGRGTLKGALDNFLEETTIHGFRHTAVTTGSSVIKRVFWMLTVLTAFVFAGLLIRRSLFEAAVNPMLTYQEVIPVTEVPFPAITVVASDPVNRHGTMAQVLNRLCFDVSWRKIGRFVTSDPLRSPCTTKDTVVLRRDFEPFLKAVEQKLYTDAKFYLSSSPAKLQEYLTYNLWFEDVNGTLPDLIAAGPKGDAKFLEIAREATSLFEAQTKTELGGFRRSFYRLMDHIKWVTTFGRLSASPFEGANDTRKEKAWFSFYGEMVTFREALHVASFFLSQGDLTEEILLGDLLDGKYAKTSSIGVGKGQVGDTLRNISLAFLPDPELNVNDIPLYLDHRVISHTKMLTCFYGCHRFMSDCRSLLDALRRNFKDVLKNMKWTLQPISRLLPIVEFDLDYAAPLGNLHYAKKPLSLVSNPLLFACDFGALLNLPLPSFVSVDLSKYLTLSECLGFFRSFTSAGIGYSYNTVNFWELFRSSPGLQHFFDIMNPKGNKEPYKRFQLSMNVSSHSEFLETLASKVVFAAGAGPKNGLLLYLGSDARFYDQLKVLVHSPFEPALVESSAISLTKGMKHTVYISPSKNTMDMALRNLPMSKRDCLFDDERQLKIFKSYNKASCLFECAMLKAHKKCGCIPWDYPQFDEGLPICLRQQDQCFREHLKNPQIFKTCDCPRSCSSITYSYSVVSSPLNFRQDCQRMHETRVPHGKLLIEQLERADSFADYTKWPWVFATRDDFCRLVLEDVAEIQFQLTSDTVMEVIQQPRVTFADQLANIGGCISLHITQSTIFLMYIISSLFLQEVWSGYFVG